MPVGSTFHIFEEEKQPCKYVNGSEIDESNLNEYEMCMCVLYARVCVCVCVCVNCAWVEV